MAFQIACEEGNLDDAQYWLNKLYEINPSFDLNTLEYEGLPLIVKISLLGHANIVTFLLNNGVVATQKYMLESIRKMFFYNNWMYELQENKKYSLARLACYSGKKDVLSVLMNRGLVPESHERRHAEIACRFKRENIVIFLLARKVTATPTLITYTVRKKLIEVVSILLQTKRVDSTSSNRDVNETLKKAHTLIEHNATITNQLKVDKEFYEQFR